MSGAASDSTSSSSSGMILRVCHSGGHTEEFYVAHGLTIGRSPAKTVVLSDDTTVDRSHAEVSVDIDGSAWIKCLQPDGRIVFDGESAGEFQLAPGQMFEVGATRFECLAEQRRDSRNEQDLHAACPLCGTRDIPVSGHAPLSCSQCEELLLPVSPDRDGESAELVPCRFGTYQAVEFVARGGMGIVLKGTGPHSEASNVAIKLVRESESGDAATTERFRQEVELLGRVRHPHVVRLLNHGQAGPFHYLVTEWIDGETLREVIEREQRRRQLVPFEVGADWFAQVCGGLGGIHALGIVHRDVKPSNILIGRDGRARLADLGIAKPLDGRTAGGLTTTGQAPGTFLYMSPEQVHSPETIDQRADQYSLGVTFYELFTGLRPHGRYPSASSRNTTVPAKFDRVLDRLLAPQPEDRFNRIEEVLAALGAPEERASPVGLPYRTKESARRLVTFLVPLLRSFAVSLWRQMSSVVSTFRRIPKPGSADESLRCWGCKRRVAAEDRFCTECGQVLSVRCPKCTAESAGGSRYCPGCGLDLREFLRAERLCELSRRAFKRSETAESHAAGCRFAEEALRYAEEAMQACPDHRLVQEQVDAVAVWLDRLLLQAAEAAYSKQEFGVAADYYRRFLNRHPGHTQASRRLEQIEVRRRQRLNAVREAQQEGRLRRALRLAKTLRHEFSGDPEIEALQAECEANDRRIQELISRVSRLSEEKRFVELEATLQELSECGIEIAGLDAQLARCRRELRIADRSVANARMKLDASRNGKLAGSKPSPRRARRGIRDSVSVPLRSRTEAPYQLARQEALHALDRVADHPQGLALLGDTEHAQNTISNTWPRLDRAIQERRWFSAQRLLTELSQAGVHSTDLDRLADQLRANVGAINRYCRFLTWFFGGAAILLLTAWFSRLIGEGVVEILKDIPTAVSFLDWLANGLEQSALGGELPFVSVVPDELATQVSALSGFMLFSVLGLAFWSSLCCQRLPSRRLGRWCAAVGGGLLFSFGIPLLWVGIYLQVSPSESNGWSGAETWWQPVAPILVLTASTAAIAIAGAWVVRGLAEFVLALNSSDERRFSPIATGVVGLWLVLAAAMPVMAVVRHLPSALLLAGSLAVLGRGFGVARYWLLASATLVAAALEAATSRTGFMESSFIQNSFVIGLFGIAAFLASAQRRLLYDLAAGIGLAAVALTAMELLPPPNHLIMPVWCLVCGSLAVGYADGLEFRFLLGDRIRDGLIRFSRRVSPATRPLGWFRHMPFLARYPTPQSNQSANPPATD